MQHLWQALPKPFFVLAPMEDVTDPAFRRMFARHGKPHVLWTEFISADGLLRAPEEGQRKLRHKLLYAPEERPIVAQFFSKNPEAMECAARIAAEMGYDGVDINMGCPDKTVEKQGAGAAMIKNPSTAVAVIEAAKRGATINGTRIAVSVKTRIGYNDDQLDSWIPTLLSTGIDAITIHARTRKEMSDVPAHWDAVARVVALRDKLSPTTVIIGNGDVKTIAEARTRATETGCDGIMIGRGAFGNPWLFSEHHATPRERIEGLREHLHLFKELMSDFKGYAVMKKHFKAYISGWDHATDLRAALMATETIDDAIAVLDTHLATMQV